MVSSSTFMVLICLEFIIVYGIDIIQNFILFVYIAVKYLIYLYLVANLNGLTV